MSLMAASSCCCGVECTCPVETVLPSSVSLTITVNGCEGTTAVLTCVLLLNANAPCQVGVCLCPKYSFTANLNTPAGCVGNYGCNMPWDYFDACEDAGQALIGITSVGLGTNGTGQNADPYVLCDIWTINIRFALRAGIANPTSQSSGSNVCWECYWFNPEAPCVGGPGMHTDVMFWKPTGQDPRGTYVSAIGSPLEFCALTPSCEGPCYGGIGMEIIDITVT